MIYNGWHEREEQNEGAREKNQRANQEDSF
jgi:hypothetical protein